MKKLRFRLIALVGFLALTSVNWSPEELGIRLSDPDAVKHHGTTIFPSADSPMPRGRNVLWCATFQIAWNSAIANYGRPLRLSPPSKLAESLNRGHFDRRWVDEESVIIADGKANEAFLTGIDREVKRQSGKRSKLIGKIRESGSADDLVFYARLEKQLEFPQAFGKLGSWKVGDHKVPWFGFSPEQEGTGPLRQQVRVHHYGARNDFVIELVCKQAGDQLLLAKLPAVPKSPAETSSNVLRRLRANSPQAAGDDLLAVPNVVADEEAAFSELEGRSVAGTGRFVRSALQAIEFRMDEKGVKLKSEAALSLGCSAHVRVEPRLMILDPPFAVVMKRVGAPQPYFVGWFANADLLRAK